MYATQVEDLSLGQLVLAVQSAQNQVRAACVVLWYHMASLEPKLLEVQRALSWSDIEAAQWIESALHTQDAHVDWRQQTQSWLGQLRRESQGFTG